MGISRNTVKRYCQGENMPWEGKHRRYERPVTGPVEEVVREWLAKDKTAPAKQRHTADRIYQRLVEEHGFTGAPSTVRKLVKELRLEGGKAFVPLEFDPGEAAQILSESRTGKYQPETTRKEGIFLHGCSMERNLSINCRKSL
ncbi:MAG: hypothetical protein D9V47_12505 [Clostridia bacterium]|nr:MAG: hypothetical protein D9V47_12505 [Clostridia bacterium]